MALCLAFSGDGGPLRHQWQSPYSASLSWPLTYTEDQISIASGALASLGGYAALATLRRPELLAETAVVAAMILALALSILLVTGQKTASQELHYKSA